MINLLEEIERMKQEGYNEANITGYELSKSTIYIIKKIEGSDFSSKSDPSQ